MLVINLVGNSLEVNQEIAFLKQHHIVLNESKQLNKNSKGDISVMLEVIQKVETIMLSKEFTCNCCNNKFKISTDLLNTKFLVENVGKAKIFYEDLSQDQLLSKTEVESLCDYLKGVLSKKRFIELEDTTLVPTSCQGIISAAAKKFNHKEK